MITKTPLEFEFGQFGNISTGKKPTDKSGLSGTIEKSGSFGELLNGQAPQSDLSNIDMTASISAKRTEIMKSLLATEKISSDDAMFSNQSNSSEKLNDLENFNAVSGLLARFWNKKELVKDEKNSEIQTTENAENELAILSRRKNIHALRGDFMRIINDITEFIFAEDAPKKADLIIAVGGSFPQMPEKAAELFKKGLAPYVLTTGRFTHNLGHFRGVSDKLEIYNKPYVTECDFYHDVLINNGVPETAIIREDKAEFTRENAEFSRKLIDEKGLKADTILVVCKSFHARRCQMFFQSAFDKSEVLMIPVDIGTGEDRNDWFKSEKGIERILGELKRIGEQINSADIARIAGN